MIVRMDALRFKTEGILLILTYNPHDSNTKTAAKSMFQIASLFKEPPFFLRQNKTE